MSFYRFTEHFSWFIARVIDNNDPDKLGRCKIRVIHEQTGELAKKVKSTGISDDELLWAYPISAIQSASLAWEKIDELEEYTPPDWIGSVGLSPTGIAIGTYVFGFYLDGHEANHPMIFGTYHKLSRYPEPPTDPQTGELLQIRPPENTEKIVNDIARLARGETEEGPGQTLPKGKTEAYAQSALSWPTQTVDENPTAYEVTYPYNLTYTTKSGHAVELDDSIGHERIHVWHMSGSYEEIANGPGLGDSGDYPNGPNTYIYHTAGNQPEKEFIGRRTQKTVDSYFQIVGKDHNELLQRDHNVEIANTETIRIGNTHHLTVGHATPPSNRINDNGETEYNSGGLAPQSVYLDTANQYQQTTGNNYALAVGWLEDQHRFTDEDQFNYYVDIANNTTINTGNNHTETIGNNSTHNIGNNQTVIVGANSDVTIGDNSTITVGQNCTITVGGNLSVTVTGTADIHSNQAMNISSDNSITMTAPRIDLNP